MSKIVLPGQGVLVDTPTGVDPVWYEKLKQMEAFINLFSEINFSAVTNGQVMVWDATKKKFLPGAN